MISGISGSSTSLATWQSMMQQRKQDMSELSSALQSGDLSSAKSAFADLQSLNQGGSNQSSASSSSAVSGSTGSNELYNDLGTLAQALKSGNIDDAQSAFAQLQSDLQSLGGPQSTDSSASSTSMSQALAAYGQNSGQDPASLLLAAIGSLSDSNTSLSVSA
jgi:soluble cytochrome b562